MEHQTITANASAAGTTKATGDRPAVFAGRIDVLDGWRAASILLVLAGHWLPLGPARFGLNGATAASGMALFFTLSGFLIARALLRDDRVGPFLIRRFFRIVPLAWAAMLVLFVATGSDVATLVANLLFYANLPPSPLLRGGEHLWSLCVEAQFYVAIAGLIAIGGRRGMYLVPLIGLAVTLARIVAAEPLSIVTWHRVDEILAGASLALLLASGRVDAILARLPSWTVLLLAPLLLASGSTATGFLPYVRPYIAATLVGVSMFSAPRRVHVVLCSAPARYIATISYAVYVLHGMLATTWLGSGDKLVKYAKRPLLLAVTVLLAHWSTFRFEGPMIDHGKALSRRLYRR